MLFDRMWWFLTGLVAGGFVTARAVRRAPRAGDLRAAAAHTGADALGLAARLVRSSGNRGPFTVSRKP
jgi:hypothetical protein